MIEPIGNILEADHTGSSQYASAGSEAESDMSMGIQRMSLGPAGATFLRKSLDQSEMEARSAQEPIVRGKNCMGSGQLQSYFEAAMMKYEQEQMDRARQAASVAKWDTNFAKKVDRNY